MSSIWNQWIRKTGLFLSSEENLIDLSDFHIKFSIQNADQESPNTCAIRVYNLAQGTLNRILPTNRANATKGEFNNVTLNAGYENGNFGAIFQGTIKQFRIGRENATDTYLDILAADGDISYNQGVVNTTLGKGATQAQIAQTAAVAMGTSVDLSSLKTDKQHFVNQRSTVLFGMARAKFRNLASTLDSSWSLQDGQVVMIDNAGYRDGEIVQINVGTGLIGMPEQTGDGIRIQCLLNPKLRIGCRVQLNNSEITQLLQSDPNAAAVPYNQWAGLQALAPLSPDGTYRAFVIEHEGDNRGTAWYSNIIGLAVDETALEQNSVSPT